MAEPPNPPSRQELATVLAQAADSEPLLADRPVAELGHGIQLVDLKCGWMLSIWWHQDERMGPLHGALAPDGRRWTYGCDRWPDWLAGPAAVVLDPLTHLISPEQREALRLRLLSCSCWPPREPWPLRPYQPLTPEQEDALWSLRPN